MQSHEKIASGLILAAMMATAGLVTYVWANPEPVDHGTNGGMLSTFSSTDQLFDFLTGSSRSGLSYNDTGHYDFAPATAGDKGSESYSRTNVQVAGVDEMDSVKTDGKYVYIASYDSVSVLEAYPPTAMANVSLINASDIIHEDRADVYIGFSGIFTLPQKLVVIGTWYEYNQIYYDYESGTVDSDYRAGFSPVQIYGPRSYVFVFDLADPATPELDLAVGISGYVQTARMIDDTVYLIAQQYEWMIEDDAVLPRTWVGEDSVPLDLNSIFYDPEMRDARSFMNVLAVDVSSEDYDSVSIVAGYASTVYMSHEAIFLSIQKWTGEIILLDNGLEVDSKDTITTTIFKLAFEGLSMKAVARGDVGGWLLNQFSMDENDGYLRIATTNMWFQRADGEEMSSSVFVLDSNLDLVGELNGIAPTERIYSARFVDDTLYLVTFRQIDPLFVIDLSDPANPEIVGELEMPGFSSYLHPVDATHVLGIGTENSSVKVSLYDVSDPTAPVEQSKFLLEGYTHSWSDAQYDHKAVLFDLEKGILVIPVTAYKTYSWDYYYKSDYLAGALVLNVSTVDGLSLRGIVEHDSPYPYGWDNVFRSFYIDDYLYTISDTTVKASLLSDLSEVNSLIYRMNEYWVVYAV